MAEEARIQEPGMIAVDISMLISLIFALVGFVGGYCYGHLQGEASAKKHITDAIKRMN